MNEKDAQNKTVPFLKTKEGEFEVLSYPGGKLEAPPSLMYSMLTLENGSIYVDENVATIRAFSEYKTEAANWFEINGKKAQVHKIQPSVLKAIFEHVVEPGEEETEDTLASLFGAEETGGQEEEKTPPEEQNVSAQENESHQELEMENAEEQKKNSEKTEVVPAEENISENKPGLSLKASARKDVETSSPKEKKTNVVGQHKNVPGKQFNIAEPGEDIKIYSHTTNHVMEAEGPVKDMVLFLSDGNMYVSANHKRNKDVRYYVSKVTNTARKTNLNVQVHYVSLDELAEMRYAFGANLVSARFGGGNTSESARLIYNIIRDAVRDGSSDIHIRVEKTKTSVFYRKTGWLRPVQELTREQGVTICSTALNTMTQEFNVPDSTNKSFEPRKFGNGQFDSLYLPKGLFNIREFNAPTTGGNPDDFTMVLRLQYGSGADDKVSFESLGYRKDQMDLLEYLAGQKTGITVFSGPMGSGKSTSLQAMLRYIIATHPVQEGKGIHVVTLEDPVEYIIPGASQISVPGGSFSKAVSAIMRFDVDVLMIGEMRDQETASKGVEMALTGHQVWTTLHANDEISILRRLADLKVREDLLYDHTIFRGLVTQRLLPLLCESCKIPASEKTVGSEMMKRIRNVLTDGENNQVFVMGDDMGCSACNGLGIRGRTVVAGIVVTDPYMMSLLRSGKFNEARHYIYGEKGCQPMMQHALNLLLAGKVDPRHVEERIGWLATTWDEDKLSVSRIQSIMGRQ